MTTSMPEGLPLESVEPKAKPQDLAKAFKRILRTGLESKGVDADDFTPVLGAMFLSDQDQSKFDYFIKAKSKTHLFNSQLRYDTVDMNGVLNQKLIVVEGPEMRISANRIMSRMPTDESQAIANITAHITGLTAQSAPVVRAHTKFLEHNTQPGGLWHKLAHRNDTKDEWLAVYHRGVDILEGKIGTLKLRSVDISANRMFMDPSGSTPIFKQKVLVSIIEFARHTTLSVDMEKPTEIDPSELDIISAAITQLTSATKLS